jgi:hypothetical protein
MWTQAPAAWSAVDDLGQRVDGAGVDVAGLRAHDRRALAGGQSVAQRGRVDAPVASTATGTSAAVPEAQDPRRAVDRHVALLADQQAHVRSALQPADLGVPADAREDGVARRRQARDVRLLAAGGQAEGRAGGKASRSSSQPPATSSTTDAAGDTE